MLGKMRGDVFPLFIRQHSVGLSHDWLLSPITPAAFMPKGYQLKSCQTFKKYGYETVSNGFWAKAGHMRTHTDAYFEKMWDLLKNARTENEAVSALSKLRQMAESGVFK
jgi:hypothetical protein